MFGVGSAAVARAQPPGAAAAQGCAAPAALLAAGEEVQARAMYVAILKARPSTACAQLGLEKINGVPAKPPKTCTAADGMFDAGDLAGALAAYRRLGDLKCADAGVAAVREVTRICLQGDVQHRLAHNDEARTAYNAALKEDPSAACASDGLKRLDALSASSVFNDISTWIPRVLIGVGLVLLAFLLLLLLGYSRSMKRLLLHFPPARPILSPRLSLGPLDDSCLSSRVGATIAARIKECLQRYRDEALGNGTGDYDLDFAAGGEDFVDIVSGDGALSNALDNARDISDQTKTVAALVDFVFGILPIQKITVAGVLDPPTSAGAGATLILQDGSRQKAAVTLTVPAAGQVSDADYLRLAPPSAVWVQYEVARVLNGDRRAFTEETAESYALLREGLDRQAEGDDLEAEKAYEQSVALNERNWAARVNLATLRARRAADYTASIATVAEALADIRADVVAGSWV